MLLFPCGWVAGRYLVGVLGLLFWCGVWCGCLVGFCGGLLCGVVCGFACGLRCYGVVRRWLVGRVLDVCLGASVGCCGLGLRILRFGVDLVGLRWRRLSLCLPVFWCLGLIDWFWLFVCFGGCVMVVWGVSDCCFWVCDLLLRFEILLRRRFGVGYCIRWIRSCLLRFGRQW